MKKIIIVIFFFFFALSSFAGDEIIEVYFYNPKADTFLFCACPTGNPEDVQDKDCVEKTQKEFEDFIKGKVQVKYVFPSNYPQQPKK